MTTQKNNNPIIFGEVLYDTFDDGTAILGGAPFNVAWHLKGFGYAPFFISCIGNDSSGKNIINAMQSWSMDTSGIQHDADHPTGKVSVTLNEGQPSFIIHPNQAYDNISPISIAKSPLFYHGSLIARGDSKTVLEQTSHSNTFVDINLRAPWYEINAIKAMLHKARWAKMNSDELNVISNDDSPLLIKTAKICSQYNLDLLIVTLGSKGVIYSSNDEHDFIPAVPVNNLIDTVGAGDAFSSVAIIGLIEQWPYEKIMQRAVDFASKICQQKGATSPNMDYSSLKNIT
jgi:fructokinase